MPNWISQPNLYSADEFYARLLEVHEARSKEESDAINARLILILANQIGDRQILEQALQIAADPSQKPQPH